MAFLIQIDEWMLQSYKDGLWVSFGDPKKDVESKYRSFNDDEDQDLRVMLDETQYEEYAHFKTVCGNMNRILFCIFLVLYVLHQYNVGRMIWDGEYDD
jgi:hypothetical protein